MLTLVVIMIILGKRALLLLLHVDIQVVNFIPEENRFGIQVQNA